MATVVINSNYPRNFQGGLATPANRGTSYTSNSGGFFFYSNNPEEVKNESIAENGRYLMRAPVRGGGQIYTWHTNSTSYNNLKNCIQIHNPNAFPIKVSSSNYGTTRFGGAQPDSNAWLSFWNTSMYSPITKIVQPGSYETIFFQDNIPVGGVFGIVARVSVTNYNTGADADATFWDVAYYSNTSNALNPADVDGHPRQRGIGQGGYWNYTAFDRLTPNNQYGSYYTLASSDDTFSGADVPWVGDPSGKASGGVLGNYGVQMNITLPIYNESYSSRTFRIYIGSIGGAFFPCFYYNGVGYRYSPPNHWGDIPTHHSLDILELTIPGRETYAEYFQVVVPAVSSAPLVIGARLL